MIVLEQAISRIMTTTRRNNRLTAPLTPDASCEPVTLVQERTEQWPFERLRVELQDAFAVPDADYMLLTAAEIIARNER